MPLHCTLARGLDRQVPQKLFATEDELHVCPVGVQTSVHCKGARWLSEPKKHRQGCLISITQSLQTSCRSKSLLKPGSTTPLDVHFMDTPSD